uniref:Uncharacterized protein n=1 Tax=Janibacter limosus TaxID=53458 RepID=A0AC61U7M6_9MICO|nr:hypothetical protein [Janibacter limosus]
MPDLPLLDALREGAELLEGLDRAPADPMTTSLHRPPPTGPSGPPDAPTPRCCWPSWAARSPRSTPGRRRRRVPADARTRRRPPGRA